jgi:general secretion pathway protein M
MTQFMEWWGARAPRERVLLCVLAIVLTGTVYAFGIIKPLYGSLTEAKQNYARAVDQSAVLMEKVKRIEAAGQMGLPSGPASLEDIRASAAAKGLTIKSAISGAGGVSRVVFEDVEAAVLLDWVMGLRGTVNVSIYELQIQRSAPGLVAASVSLRQIL